MFSINNSLVTTEWGLFKQFSVCLFLDGWTNERYWDKWKLEGSIADHRTPKSTDLEEWIEPSDLPINAFDTHMILFGDDTGNDFYFAKSMFLS